MDDRRFDELTRTFAGVASRRSVLKTLTGGALAAAGAVFGVGSAAAACRNPGEICRKNGECCSNFCGPKDATGRQRCACPAGTTLCNGACKAAADLASDPQNCGACGNVCSGSGCLAPACSDGVCGTVAGTCPDDGNVCTDNTCNLDTGACDAVPNDAPCDTGNLCTENDVCSEGTCTPGTPISCDDADVCTVDTCDAQLGCQYTIIPACPGNEASCGGDGSFICNCGEEAGTGGTVCVERFGCGGRPDCTATADCPAGQICVVAECCGSPSGNICVVPCGELIATGETCTADGQCASGACCGGVCTDTQTNDAHCGACDAPCDSGTEVCEAGICNPLGPEPMCRGEDACLGSVGCGEPGLGCSCGTLVNGGGMCRETIGDCSTPTGCDSDADCDNGRVCVQADNCCPVDGFDGICTTPCGEMAVGGPCTLDDNCAEGLLCESGLCAPACSTTVCTVSTDCCSGACVCSAENFETCQVPFFQGFETDIAGWTGSPVSGTPTRVASGTNGITSATGSFHAQATTGAFTRWGGYTNVFPTGGFSTSVKVYLDMTPGVANDTRFDYTAAINGTGCAHRRDFAFNAGFYNDTDVTGSGARYVINASNNVGRANSFPKNPARSPYAITAEGWYTFTHQFQNVAGVLQVTLTVSGPGGSNFWILSDPTDTIPANVGGNRYGWFSSIELPFLAIDDSSRP